MVNLIKIFQAYFGRDNGVDLDQQLHDNHKPHEPIDFVDCDIDLINPFL